MNILGPLIVIVAIGCGVAVLTWQVPKLRTWTLGSQIVLGVAGAVAVGFVLPQFGVPVSSSVTRGVLSSAVGAMLPFLPLYFLRD